MNSYLLDASGLLLVFAALIAGRGLTLDGLRDWYRRWVHLREVRYRVLAEILDDIEKRRG
jgi:hypothetical protein